MKQAALPALGRDRLDGGGGALPVSAAATYTDREGRGRGERDLGDGAPPSLARRTCAIPIIAAPLARCGSPLRRPQWGHGGAALWTTGGCTR